MKTKLITYCLTCSNDSWIPTLLPILTPIKYRPGKTSLGPHLLARDNLAYSSPKKCTDLTLVLTIVGMSKAYS